MKNKTEHGALIVEASIVFPVMFLVIFFLIYAANAYFQRCRIESIINECAIEAAAYCSDPYLQAVERNELPDMNTKIKPYRRFGSGAASQVESDTKKQIEERIKQLDSGHFGGMKPQNVEVATHYHSQFLYATFSVDASYRIELPVKLWGAKKNSSLKFSTHVEMPVSDTTELIRNLDMVWDYMERYGVVDEIEKMAAAAKEWLTRS